MTPLPCDSVLAGPLRKVKEETIHSVAEATRTLTAEYNGWTNREAWVMNLWLISEEYYYHELHVIIKNFDSDGQLEGLSSMCSGSSTEMRLVWQLTYSLPHSYE